jgi:hypothetical protein
MSMADRKTDGQLAAAPQRPPVPLPWAEIRGRGPAVVLLHGLADSHELWRNQIPVLEHRFRTIAVDHYGHGRSPLPPERLTTAVMADGGLPGGRRREDANHLTAGASRDEDRPTRGAARRRSAYLADNQEGLPTLKGDRRRQGDRPELRSGEPVGTIGWRDQPGARRDSAAGQVASRTGTYQATST